MRSVRVTTMAAVVSVVLVAGGCTGAADSPREGLVRPTATALPLPSTAPSPQEPTPPMSGGDSSPDLISQATWVVGAPAAGFRATFEDPTLEGRFWRPWQGPSDVGEGLKVLVLRSFNAAGERTDADLLVVFGTDPSETVVDAMVLSHDSLGLTLGASCAGSLPMVLIDSEVGRARAWRVDVDPFALTEVSVRSNTVDAECAAPRPAATGVADDDPAVFLDEIAELRDSAGPGRIVGFVRLRDDHGSFPLSPVQPVCVGVGDYRRVVPGAAVSAMASNGEVLSVATLRGSAFDGPIGCSLWFGLDLSTDPGDVSIDISGHGVTQPLDTATLDDGGWTVRISPVQVNPSEFCAEGELCVSLEPLD